jgi:hypothetical protein
MMRRIFRSAFAHPFRRSPADTRELVKSHFGANPTTVSGVTIKSASSLVSEAARKRDKF